MRTIVISLFTLYLTTTAIVPALLAETEKPNVVFIFTDDQAYETISAYGMVDIDTPNMDRLAAEGTTFSHAYNMGAWSGAVCTASRTSLNTGAFLWRAKAALNDVEAGKRKLWGQLMKDAGYETYMTGKWHVPYPAPKAFDHAEHVRPGMPKAEADGYNRPKDEADYESGWKPWDTTKGGFWEGGKHWSEVTADDSVAFIEGSLEESVGDFLYVSLSQSLNSWLPHFDLGCGSAEWGRPSRLAITPASIAGAGRCDGEAEGARENLSYI